MLLVSVFLAVLPRVWQGLRVLPPRLIAIYAGIGVIVALHWLTFYGAIKLANASVAVSCLALGSIFTAIIEPMRAIAQKHFPGVPMLAMMSTGATDAIFITPVGIPGYGAPGTMIDADGNGIHGLNERISVRSLMQGRDYLSDLAMVLANPK